jgi:phosphoribosylanthranilate isomerase
MWVKICGNTNLEDARLAADLGADAVGFVFASSPRQVTPSQVARITPHLPESLERVGVFPAWSASQIADAVREASLTTVQLHGAIEPGLMETLQNGFQGNLRIIPVVHWTIDLEPSSDPDVADSSTADKKVRGQLHQLGRAQATNRILIDSKIGGVTGGTGIPFDWKAAQAVFLHTNPQMRLILAGGLTPYNLAEAIDRLQPWGVDVSSGVEASVGRKDPEKVASFIRQARLGGRTPVR